MTTRLPNGLRVVTEAVPGVRSAALGIWVGVGSRDEADEQAGSSHYLEHLLFKGTQRRSALEISAALEAVGGDLNAFTSREHTCYYARVLDRDLPLALDVLSDMVLGSLLRAEDVDAERGVVLEEIAMRDDDPGDLVHDMFTATVLGDNPLGRPVLGTVESIKSLERDTIAGYYTARYQPAATVVAVSGSLDHDAVRDAVAATWGGVGEPAEPLPPRGGTLALDGEHARHDVLYRQTEQANLVVGTSGLSRHDDRRYALGLLSTALGEGMSSRLFQEIREKRGLAYSVYSFTANYADTGLFGVYVGCPPQRADEVLRICRDELAAAVADGLTDEELERAKGQTRGSLLLGLEDTGSRMNRIGKAELSYGEVESVDELLAKVEAVTLDDVRAVAADVLDRPLSLAAIGPFGEDELLGALR